MNNNKIFIQIASYRDPELVPTIKSLIDNAKWPQNLVFSIANQYHPDDEWHLDAFRFNNRFKIIDILASESKGACYARNLLQQAYNGEEWTLQIDSHMRFAQNWDQILIDMWTGLHNSGVSKPLITTYLPQYDPENDPEGRVNEPWFMSFRTWTPEGVLLYNSCLANGRDLSSPVPTYFYSAHFAFTKGDFVKEVPHDPELYFHGEECSIAARAWTWGYDLFHPHTLIAWHEYTRSHRVKHWDDNKEWWKLDHKSKLRYNYLVGQKRPRKPITWGPYGWGPIRDFADYAKVSGIDFKKRIYNV